MCLTHMSFDRSKAYPHFAHYLDKMVVHEKTYLYSFIQQGLTTYGHSTSNIAESFMMVVKQARQNDAYHFSDWVMLWIAEQIVERQEQGRLRLQQNKLLTA